MIALHSTNVAPLPRNDMSDAVLKFGHPEIEWAIPHDGGWVTTHRRSMNFLDAISDASTTGEATEESTPGLPLVVHVNTADATDVIRRSLVANSDPPTRRPRPGTSTYPVTGAEIAPSSRNSRSTRRRMSSRIGRTAATSSPAGSSSSQSS